MEKCESIFCEKQEGEVRHYDEPVEGWYHPECWTIVQQDYLD